MDKVITAFMQEKEWERPSLEPDGSNDEANDTPAKKTYRCTDIGNGERFADQHRGLVRYSHPEHVWYVWAGKKWEKDSEGAINRLAKETARSVYEEAANEEDSEKRARLAKWAAASESTFRQNAMLSMAKSELGISVLPEDLDRDSWLLNLNNGTYNLKSGELLPHNKDDLITKLIPINYNSESFCNGWLEFLERLMNANQDLINYICRVAGYALTGDTGEQCLFVLWGIGQNGKSTFLNVLQSILKDYALQTDFSTFTIKRNEGVRNDIARMRKSRLVVAIETGDGKRLDEPVVKQLTGGDRVTSRFLHQEYFEYRPEFKIFLATNYKPTIYGQDLAIWRRIRLIPFNVTISDSERINNYENILLEEKEGILNWMIYGCQQWLKHGLNEPDEVKVATASYRTEMDILENFIAARCFMSDGGKTAHKDLYAAYVEWCDENVETPIKTRTFAKRMEGRGFTFTKPKNVKTWRGIGLV